MKHSSCTYIYFARPTNQRIYTRLKRHQGVCCSDNDAERLALPWINIPHFKMPTAKWVMEFNVLILMLLCRWTCDKAVMRPYFDWARKWTKWSATESELHLSMPLVTECISFMAEFGYIYMVRRVQLFMRFGIVEKDIILGDKNMCKLNLIFSSSIRWSSTRIHF